MRKSSLDFPPDSAPTPEEQKKESDALFSLFKARQSVDKSLSQGSFGAKYGLGSQGNVGHYLHGRQPLNIKAALAFANELQCHVEEFSPRLAALIRKMAVNDPIVEAAEGIARLPQPNQQMVLDFISYQFERADAKLFEDGKTLQHYLQMMRVWSDSLKRPPPEN